MADFKKLFPGLVALLILATVFWGPTLFAGKSLIHGDALGHGLPLLDLQSRSLGDLGQLLWSDKIYGGHALFAEGQGGFANPVNMIFAWIVAPIAGSIYAANLFHWFCMVSTGIGILLLCRSLGLGAWASCLGAVAGVFSLDTIGQAQNLTVSGALMWVPWALWALERWLARPGIGSAALLGSIIAIELYSGYPEILDGIVIYMIAVVLVGLTDGPVRHTWAAAWRTRFGTGALGVLVAVGLSAVQLLPELELIGQSHRSGGITIPLQIPIVAYVRGFLFTRDLAGSVLYYPLVGSILISALASSTLVLPTARALKGHMLGTAFLIVLGMGDDTWLFRFIYAHDLLPQLHYYRVLLVYINCACLTTGVLAAAGAEGLARWVESRPGTGERWFSMRIALLALFIAFWIWLVWRLYLPDVSWLQPAIAVVAVAGAIFTAAIGRARLIPIFFAFLVIGEIAALRSDNFRFGDTRLLQKPSSIALIQSLPDWKDYKIYNESLVGGFAPVPPTSPDLMPKMKRMFPAAVGLSNLLWDLHSIDGALALALGRREAISQLMDDETYGRITTPPGARLIDMLGIRWVVFDAQPISGGFRTFWHEDPDSVWIMENPAARPRFQIFSGCESVASMADDIVTVGTLKAPTLVVERQGDADPCAAPAADPTDAASTQLTVLKAKSTRYHFHLSGTVPSWLFVADANYPGWTATLDGKDVAVYSAEVLGKAVAVPAGEHDVRLRFVSRSFLWGLGVTLVTLAAMIATSVAGRGGRFRR